MRRSLDGLERALSRSARNPTEIAEGLELYWPKASPSVVHRVARVSRMGTRPERESRVDLVDDYGSRKEWQAWDLAEAIDRGFARVYDGGVPLAARRKILKAGSIDPGHMHRLRVGEKFLNIGVESFTWRLAAVVDDNGRTARAPDFAAAKALALAQGLARLRDGGGEW